MAGATQTASFGHFDCFMYGARNRNGASKARICTFGSARCLPLEDNDVGVLFWLPVNVVHTVSLSAHQKPTTISLHGESSRSSQVNTAGWPFTSEKYCHHSMQGLKIAIGQKPVLMPSKQAVIMPPNTAVAEVHIALNVMAFALSCLAISFLIYLSGKLDRNLYAAYITVSAPCQPLIELAPDDSVAAGWLDGPLQCRGDTSTTESKSQSKTICQSHTRVAHDARCHDRCVGSGDLHIDYDGGTHEGFEERPRPGVH
jgi:hypothetical protein